MNRIITASALAVGLLSLLLSWTAVSRMSLTVDEYQALPSGLAMLETGDFRFPNGTPLLSEVLPAIPAYLAGERLGELARNPGLNNWAIALESTWRYGASFPALFVGARAVSLAFLALTLFLVFGYGRSLYGGTGGLLALTVAGLCPNLLGHGALVTPDIYLGAATVAYLWGLDGLSRRPGWLPALLLGFSLALAAATKFTGLAYFPLAFPLVWIAASPADRESAFRYLVVALLVAYLGLHAAYAFHGSAARFGDFQFSSGLFQGFQRGVPGWLPVFLPHDYVKALDEQVWESSYLAYLLGSFNREGFYSYYLVAFFAKTPLPTLGLAALAAVDGGRVCRRERMFLIFAAAMFVLFSLGRHKNIGLRYLLFLFPLLGLWCGRAAARAGELLTSGWRRWVGGALLASLFLGTLLAWPDYIAYFSPLVGGGDEGHRVLLDSNLDWGQGLLELREFLAENHVGKISLAYYGRMNPALYGLKFENLEAGKPALPVVAISANLLWGRTYFVNGTSYWPNDLNTYSEYRGRQPWAILGHTIYVYRALSPGH